jgi:hypothetical protein
VLETVAVGPIYKLASDKKSLDCPAVFVSWLNGYSEDAIRVAESNEIFLYRLEPDGSWIPQNKRAEEFDKRNSFEAPSWIAWLFFVLLLIGIGVLYFGPLIFFYAEKPLRKAFGFSHYIEAVAVVGAACLGVLFSLIWGQASGRAWRWPASAARSVIAFGVLVVNIAIVFACVYLARSEQYPGSFSVRLQSHMQALYFSSTTLATVGYGDITPTLTRVGDWAQGAVLIEMAVTLSIVGVAFAGLGSRLAPRA